MTEIAQLASFIKLPCLKLRHELAISQPRKKIKRSGFNNY